MPSPGLYYELFWFGGRNATIPVGSNVRASSFSKAENGPEEDEEAMVEGGATVLTKKDLPTFKKSMRCYIDGCRKSFTFGGRSHCRRCGESICSDHVVEKVSMTFFGYDKNLSLFEKVCTKCYDEAMKKKVGGKLNIQRLLCYIRYFRDRTRWLRIRKGVHAVKTIQITWRYERARINRTWKDVGEDVEEEKEEEEDGDSYNMNTLGVHEPLNGRNRSATRDSIPNASVRRETYKPPRRGRRDTSEPMPQYQKAEDIHLSPGARKPDAIPEAENETEVKLAQSEDPSDSVPHPDDPSNQRRKSVKTRRVSRKFRDNPILPSQRSSDVGVKGRSSDKLDEAAASALAIAAAAAIGANDEEEMGSSGVETGGEMDTSGELSQGAPTPEHAEATTTTATSALAIPGAKAPSGSSGIDFPGPPGRLQQSFEGSLPASAFGQSADSNGMIAAAEAGLASGLGDYSIPVPPASMSVAPETDRNAALLEAQEILREQKTKDKLGMKLRLNPPGVQDGRSGASVGSEGAPGPGPGPGSGSGSGSGSGRSRIVAIGPASAGDQTNSSIDAEEATMSISPAALVSLGSSPAGVSALKEYMSNHGKIDIAVTSPHSRQYKTDEENAVERDGIEKLLELKKEATQRLHHQQYVKGLEAQAQVEAERRRQAVKEARAKRLEAEEAVLGSSSLDASHSDLRSRSGSFHEAPKASPPPVPSSALSSQEAASTSSATSWDDNAPPSVPPAPAPVGEGAAYKESEERDNHVVAAGGGTTSSATDRGADGGDDSGDEEEAKEIARLQELERKRQEALSALPPAPQRAPLPRLSASAKGEINGINSGSLTIIEAEYQHRSSGAKKRSSQAGSAVGAAETTTTATEPPDEKES